MIRRLGIYLLGMWEFRSDVTTHFDDNDDLETYDAGRERAHQLTRRRWDQTVY